MPHTGVRIPKDDANRLARSDAQDGIGIVTAFEIEGRVPANQADLTCGGSSSRKNDRAGTRDHRHHHKDAKFLSQRASPCRTSRRNRRATPASRERTPTLVTARERSVVTVDG